MGGLQVAVRIGFDLCAVHKHVFVGQPSHLIQLFCQLIEQLLHRIGQTFILESGNGGVIRHGFVLQNPHESDIMTAGGFDVSAGIDPVHICEHDKLKHGAGIDLSPVAEICGVQLGVIHFVSDFHQFSYGFTFIDSYS